LNAASWLSRARWRRAPGVAPERLATLLARAARQLAEGEPAGRVAPRKLQVPLALDGAKPDHLLKVQSYAGASPSRRARESAARAELRLALALAERGVPTPVPVAAGDCRRRGLLEASLVLTPLVADGVDLARAWDEGRAPPAARRAWARELGRLARRMHDRGVAQQDFAPNNFLWRPGEAPHLLAVDFERLRLRSRIGAGSRRRALAKLDRHLAGAPAGDRFRLLLAYARDDRAESRAWWRAVADEHAALARDDLRHLLRVAPRDGRRFVRVDAEGWRGFARRDAPLEAALRAVTRSGDGAPGSARAGAVLLRPLAPLAAREAARAWAAAQVLAQRRVAPRAVALLRREGHAFLVYEPVADGRPFAEAPAARAALVGLLDRLLAFGFVPERLALDTLIAAPGPRGGVRVLLLDPRGLDPRRPVRVRRHQAARAWADRLLPR
jgi:hypothetical protein